MQVNNRFRFFKTNLHAILVCIRIKNSQVICQKHICHDDSWNNPMWAFSLTLVRSFSDELSFLFRSSSTVKQKSVVTSLMEACFVFDDSGSSLPEENCVSLAGIWGLSVFEDGIFPLPPSSFCCCSNISWRRFPCSSMRICRFLWIWRDTNSTLCHFCEVNKHFSILYFHPKMTNPSCSLKPYPSKLMHTIHWKGEMTDNASQKT